MLTRRNWFKSSAVLFSAAALTTTAKAAEKSASGANEYDVVVLGAGCGGLVCAIEAYDQGLRPIVLEKMDAPAGNSIYASGGLAAWGTKQQEEEGHPEPREGFEADMMKVSQYRADPALIKTYCDEIGDAVEWLKTNIGVKFAKTRKKPWPIGYRMLNVDGAGQTGGAMLIRNLLAACEKRDIPILFNTKAVELLTNHKGRVNGVKALGDDGYCTFTAKDGVVVATGGFSANREMLNTYMGGPLSRIALRGSPYTTGENVSLTRPLGAMFVHMDQFHCGPIVEETHANPNFVIDAGQGLDVDVRGKRFMDEVFTYTQKSLATVTQTPENKAYHIIDSHWETAPKAAKKFRAMNSEVIVADTPEDLARKMNIEPAVFTKLFKDYNAAFKAGKLKSMEPPCSLAEPKPLDKAPFYAFPFQGGITATFGGPKINEFAQVMNTEERRIPGLYAVGNAAGGLFFGNYIGGSQLGGATVFGRVAARHMAKNHNKA